MFYNVIKYLGAREDDVIAVYADPHDAHKHHKTVLRTVDVVDPAHPHELTDHLGKPFSRTVEPLTGAPYVAPTQVSGS